MPSRVVRGGINESESLSKVSIGADLTFRALIVTVDDYGRLDARPASLKAKLFPLRKEVSPDLLSRWIFELATTTEKPPPVLLYEVGGRPFLWLTGWEKHRGKSHRASKSRYPVPPEVPENPGDPGLPEDSRRSAEAPEDPPGGMESEVGGMESRIENREHPLSPSAPGGGLAIVPEGKKPETGPAAERSADAVAKARLRVLWPRLQRRANERWGKSWRAKPSGAAMRLIVPLLKRGVSDEDLVAAIDGCGSMMSEPRNDGRDMTRYIRPETVYQPSKFDGYVDAATETTETGTSKSAVDRFLERTGGPPRETVHGGSTEDRHGSCPHLDRNQFPCTKCGDHACAECVKLQPCNPDTEF